MFWFLLITMVVVVAAVTLAVIGGGESEVLPEAAPEQLVDPLPLTRPVARGDIEALRLPVTARGYRMADVDDVLDRLDAELAERDARIADLEAALAAARSGSDGTPADDAAQGGTPGVTRDKVPGHVAADGAADLTDKVPDEILDEKRDEPAAGTATDATAANGKEDAA
ncbi:DivIVA domain-containing protein [Streptomyces laurentii]|uniref:DivIVA domain-containing protein n=1 Tax=Streptomyces laurentii TaxID=39478 RepID=UPI003683A7B6